MTKKASQRYRNPNRGRQNNGRRPRGGVRSQSRGRKNNNGRTGRSGNRQVFSPNREQVAVNLPARSEAAVRNQQGTGKQGRIIIPESQTGGASQSQNAESAERGVQENFLFHAQGSTNMYPTSREQQQ